MKRPRQRLDQKSSTDFALRRYGGRLRRVGSLLARGGEKFYIKTCPQPERLPMSVAFDTLKAARRLGAAGFTSEQAETLAGTFAEGITENLATKDDIALLQKDMKALDQKIDISVEVLDRKIDTAVDALRKDMVALKKDMTILLGSIMVGGIVVITLLDRVLAN